MEEGKGEFAQARVPSEGFPQCRRKEQHNVIVNVCCMTGSTKYCVCRQEVALHKHTRTHLSAHEAQMDADINAAKQ